MKTNLKILTVLVAGFLLLGFSGVAAHAGGKVDTDTKDYNFNADSAIIDNPYWTLNPPGRTFVYNSKSKDGCEVNYVYVTYDTKPFTIMTKGSPGGEDVEARVVQDWVYVDEECDGVVNNDDYLSENTLDYYAQDADRNVWYFGEYTEDYDNCNPNNPPTANCTDTEGSWEAGKPPAEDPQGEPAQPGIVMLAEPTPGAFYRQEYLEGEAEDMAKVLRLNARVVLTFDNNELDQREYEGCLMTKEWSPLERGAIEHKYYCPTEEFDGLLPLINELQGGTFRTELVGLFSGLPAGVEQPEFTYP